MVLIHLAKSTLLELSCDYFGKVFITPRIKREVVKKEYPDAYKIEEMLVKNKILVKEVKNFSLTKKAEEFNILGAETEAVALYWELNADFIATDDDNVRRKREILKLNIIGTPAIILKLYKEKKINKEKLNNSINIMKKIGWFNNTIWDKIMLEVEKNA